MSPRSLINMTCSDWTFIDGLLLSHVLALYVCLPSSSDSAAVSQSSVCVCVVRPLLKVTSGSFRVRRSGSKFCLIFMTSSSQDRNFRPGYWQEKSEEPGVFLKRNHVLMSYSNSFSHCWLQNQQGPSQKKHEGTTSSKFLICPVTVQSKLISGISHS